MTTLMSVPAAVPSAYQPDLSPVADSLTLSGLIALLPGEVTGIEPPLLVAANTSGGVVGKMISPQNLTIAATAVGLIGRESDILRKVLPWSIGLILAMCLLVGLQSTVLAWMLP